jgi:cytochrome c biogenesis protein CcdA/thiol-disulfide isomerase/thioredoxin
VVLLALFAFVAGAGTALSPCVLPVLPAVLSASAAGGRRRPLGVVVGLTATFTVTIAGLGAVVNGVGLGDGALRTLAAVVLLAFGVALAVPRLAAALEAPLARLARFGPAGHRGDGLRSGLAVGAALGFAYAPCAGPILAAVITVGAASGRVIVIALAYAVGSACVLLALALGGRRLLAGVRRAGRGPAVQRALGLVMVLTAVAIFANLDVRAETALATHFPAALVNPTGALERSGAVQRRLTRLRPTGRFAAHGMDGDMLPDLGRAPDFTGTQEWFNTPGGRPLTLAGLRGKVVLLDFWTYTCINCIRTLPYLKAWDARYRRDGLVVVGVHTPEFEFEHSAANVAAAIRQNGLRYPVVQDNGYATWNAWQNEAWPAHYLIDARGHVRYVHLGEGDYGGTEAAIRSLLTEAGATRLGGSAHPRAGAAPSVEESPETYLGVARAEGWLVQPQPGIRTYPGVRPGALAANRFAFSGTWDIGAQAARAVAGARIDAGVMGRAVYLVLSPAPHGQPSTVDVLLDGRPIPAGKAGPDVHRGRVTVRRQRLYQLVAVPRIERHTLTLRFAPGVTGFAFTFG